VTPGSTCFSVKVFDAKTKLLAESARWAMASYNRCTVPDINIAPVKKTDPTAKLEVANCKASARLQIYDPRLKCSLRFSIGKPLKVWQEWTGTSRGASFVNVAEFLYLTETLPT
jgi:hypothetical protein